MTNEPVSLSSVGLRHREHIREISTMQNYVTTNVNLEKEILQIEIAYKKNNIQSKMAYFNYDRDLNEIISEINLMLQENTVSVGQKAKVISSVAGTVIDTLYEAVHRGTNMTGISTGWKYLDKYLGGWNKGNMVVIAGRPGSGKTAIALSLAIDSCRLAKVLFISLEMSKEQLVQRLMCSQAEIDASRLRSGHMQSEDWAALTKAMGELADAPIFIDDTPALGVMDIRAKCRRLCMEHGNLGLVAVDYLQLMEGSSKGRIDRVQEISAISRGLKQLARELNAPVMALSQLSRAVEGRQSKKPMLSDLRESGSIEQDADIVMFIYRDDYYNPENLEMKGKAEIIIAKQRNGPVGSLHLLFQSNITKFKNPTTKVVDF